MAQASRADRRPAPAAGPGDRDRRRIRRTGRSTCCGGPSRSTPTSATRSASRVGPLWRTVQLAVIVSVATGVLGTGLAWLLVRTDVPLARVWRLLAPLPLVFPSFVGAAAFIAGLAPDGVIREVLELVGYDAPRRFRGLGASCFVLTAFTYPYVYLPVAARLAGLPTVDRGKRPPPRRSAVAPVLQDRVARHSKLGARRDADRPAVLPERVRGGAAARLRHAHPRRLRDTAASTEPDPSRPQLSCSSSPSSPSPSNADSAAHSSTAHRPALRKNAPIRLGRWRIPAVMSVLAVLLVSLVAPVVSLAQWAWRGIDGSAFAPCRARTRPGRPARTGMVDGVARNHRRRRRRCSWCSRPRC